LPFRSFSEGGTTKSFDKIFHRLNYKQKFILCSQKLFFLNFAFLIEFADGEQKEVKMEEVV
jgi:hypothetical protein